MPSEPPSVPLWLDLANECLWCGDQAQALRPKTFALLRYLVEHPDQVLPKTVLLEALWPETLVSEVVLAVCIREWLLLDSRGVDLPMSYDPIVVTLSSLKPFFFNGLQ